MEAKDASDDDGDGFWPTRPKAAKDDGRPSDLRLSPAEGDPASLDDILLSEGKDDDDEPSSPSRPSEVKDAKEIGNRQRTLSRTLSGAYRATRARVTRTSSDDGDKARKKVEALVGVLANAQATSTKLLKAASQLRVLAMDKEAKTAVVDAGAVPHLVRLADPATCGRASPPVTEAAARCLWNLAISDRNKLRIAQHGGVAALVALARDGATVGAKEAAAGALRNLAVDKANQVAVVAAGAIPPLVELLSPSASRPSGSRTLPFPRRTARTSSSSRCGTRIWRRATTSWATCGSAWSPSRTAKSTARGTRYARRPAKRPRDPSSSACAGGTTPRARSRRRRPCSPRSRTPARKRTRSPSTSSERKASRSWTRIS